MPRAGPAVLNGVVLVGSLDGHLYAVRKGVLIDKVDLGGAIVASPLASDERVYVANDTGLVLGASLNGDRIEPQWRVDLATESTTQLRLRTPVVHVGTRLLVASDAGTVFLLAR